jgi:rare lipoprotein A
MMTKAHFLMVVLLPIALLRSASAADSKPDECGFASVYSGASEKTASGEDTRAEIFTAAHRSLPFGTLVRVDNQKNRRSTVVRITDRGLFIAGRIIDISQSAARELGISGLTQVCLNILPNAESQPFAGHWPLRWTRG